MEKMRLNIDELRLESFDISDTPSQHRGTVNGHANPTDEAGGTCACNTEGCTAIDACTQEAGFATYIGSGTQAAGFATYIGSGTQAAGFATFMGSGV
jgi:hypothetical protein